jgi:hypothetical protein
MIRRVDAWIQRRFDAVVHQVMRTLGVTKRTVRRNLWCYYLAFLVIELWTLEHPSMAISVAFTLLGGGLLTLTMLLQDRYDAEAESSPGTQSRADTESSAVWNKLFGFWWLVSNVAAWVWVVPARSLYWLLVDTQTPLTLIALGYLAHTPPAAPKPKRETAPLAAPVHS